MSKPINHDKHKGARSEFVAVAWLLSLGYEVFKNVSFHGDVDIIAWKDGTFEYFDIKTINNTTVRYSLLPSQLNRNVKVLGVNLVDNSCRIIEPSLKFMETVCIECKQSFKGRTFKHKYCGPKCVNIVNNRKIKIKQLQVMGNA